MMKSFSRKAVLGVGLLAMTTMLGVYSATAGSETLQPSSMVQSDGAPSAADAGNHRVVRIVGPRFLPDNGDVTLLGAAAERAGRH